MDEIFEKINVYYNDLVRKHGYSPMSCDYGRTESQKIKFQVLSDAGSYSQRTVLDIGCGFADYANFLEERFNGIIYKGVDISDQMVINAKSRRPDLDIRKINVFDESFEERSDIVTANGIFYLLGKDAMPLMKKFIAKMYSIANEFVAFNSLSSYTTDQQPNEFYPDPAEVFKYCSSLTPWVVLRHDYHHRDFTIYMYKNKKV